MPLNAPNQSLQRATQILFAVAGASDGRTVEQIARRVNLKSNTVGRFVRTMEAEELLVRRERPLRFLIGPAIAELKHLDDRRQLLDVAGRVLVKTQLELAASNFSLAERDELETCTRLSVRASRPGVVVLHRTQLHQPYRKASAMVFLAYGSAEDRSRFFEAHSFVRQGARFWGSEAKLRAFFREIVRRGYAQPELPDEGLFRVAAPVFGPNGQVAAAVGGYFDFARGDRDRRRLRMLTVAAAAEISARIAGKL